MIRAVVSIGTNSTRGLVVDFQNQERIAYMRSIGTRIGENLKDRGHLDDAAMDRTLEAVREHAQAAREFTHDVRAIATSAVRRADNAQLFAQRVSDAVGAPLEILSGEEEARRSFIGAVSGIPEDEATFGVLDVGGGSSEYAVGKWSGPERIVSCEIGAVRLTETIEQLAGTNGPVHPETLASAERRARQAVSPIANFPAADRLVFVGGSATNAVSIERKSREPFTYARIERATLDALIERLASAGLCERKAIAGMNPQRADILLAGLVILAAACDSAGHHSALVSTRDLLMGTLLER